MARNGEYILSELPPAIRPPRDGVYRPGKLEGEAKSKKIPKQEYAAEFKDLAVKRVKAGQSVGAVARELGLIEQTLRNWVKAAAAGKLNGPGSKVVTPEQMELSRVRAENIRLKRENEILKKQRHTSRGMRCEVCLD
ncbi:MAG: transposase family protein [Rhodocyclaceae bacterium]|nr:MAG: transposase family protein [Rhodocyclaceae bacterium]TND04879.1 MAG: transposase IS3/IS911 family protein [Rhodocyclaceae bacterium]